MKSRWLVNIDMEHALKNSSGWLNQPQSESENPGLQANGILFNSGLYNPSGSADAREDNLEIKAKCILVLLTACFFILSSDLSPQKTKDIEDQEARGPAATDMQSILVVVQTD